MPGQDEHNAIHGWGQCRLAKEHLHSWETLCDGIGSKLVMRAVSQFWVASQYDSTAAGPRSLSNRKMYTSIVVRGHRGPRGYDVGR